VSKVVGTCLKFEKRSSIGSHGTYANGVIVAFHSLIFCCTVLFQVGHGHYFDK
jgi:hypothetical protein